MDGNLRALLFSLIEKVEEDEILFTLDMELVAILVDIKSYLEEEE